ncbi:MAG TPA: NUDIX hydrolase N-terminal domain-containing protein [Hanamia sp.]
MIEQSVIDLAKRIKAIADTGLLYTSDDFDKERYAELKLIGEKLLGQQLNVTLEKINSFFNKCIDYPTPKVDVRVLVLNSQKQILMVQEKSDSKWSLPGGWADIGKAPSEVAIGEVFEETGLKITCKCLSAVFDKRMHAHPPQPYYVYKMVFYGELISTDENLLKPAFDVLDVSWFAVGDLPPLSTDRILSSQIEIIYKNIMDQKFTTIFD